MASIPSLKEDLMIWTHLMLMKRHGTHVFMYPQKIIYKSKYACVNKP